MLRIPFPWARTRRRIRTALAFRANQTRPARSERGGASSGIDQSHADAVHLTFCLCIERQVNGESSQPELFQEGNLKSVFRYIYKNIYIYVYKHITIYVVLSIHIHFSGRRTWVTAWRLSLLTPRCWGVFSVYVSSVCRAHLTGTSLPSTWQRTSTKPVLTYRQIYEKIPSGFHFFTLNTAKLVK